MAELEFKNTHYDGPLLDGYRSEVDEEDLEHILIASREHIYSHPIQTLVQEYVNNGKDANRSAGNPDNLMDIVVPTYDRLEFICRDYGVGLSKDEIIQVYRKIGKSTKRKDNTLAGKYGVGAKIGFVYTDAFLITSWKNGRKVECLAHKANSQIGDYTFLSDVESDEPNGVQISIKLTDASHISQFRQAIQRMFFLWPEKPNLSVDFLWPQTDYENQHVRIFSKPRGSNTKTSNDFFEQFINNSSLWLNVDGTPYKVSDVISNRCGADIRFCHRSVYINATLSDVDIPMNREELTTNNKLEKFIRDSFQKIEDARQDVISKILSKDDYTSILDIKEHISAHTPSFKLEKIEVYAKAVDRKFTYEDGWFYMEPKDTDLFTHFLAHERDNYKEDKTRFGVNNIFCERDSVYMVNKVRKHPRNTSDHREKDFAVWLSPSAIPQDIWDFCNLRNYYDEFPKKEKLAKTSGPRVINDVVFYDTQLTRRSEKKDYFMKIYSIDKPLYYSLFENNHSRESVLNNWGDLIKFDIGDNGRIIGVIPRNLKILQSWGYRLVPVDEKYVFSKRVYLELKRSLYNHVFNYRDIYTRIATTLDSDINYLRACQKESTRGGSTLDWDDHYLPENIKTFLKREKEKVLETRSRVFGRYPFLRYLAQSQVGELDKWMSSYLIPLLLQNPYQEPSKLEEPTTDLN